MSTRQAGFALAAAAGTWLLGMAAAAGGSPGIGAQLIGIVPLAVTALWGAAWLLIAPRALVVGAALLWAAGTALAMPTGAAAGLAVYVTSGLLLGWALGRGWRPDAVLAIALVPVLLLLVAAAREAPLATMFEQAGRQMSAALQRATPSGGSGDARSAAELEAGLAQAVKLVRRLWPSLLLLGALANTALVCWLVRVTVRRARGPQSVRPWPSLPEWRLPFYMVWVLAAGLLLVLLRRQPALDAGLNVIVAATALLSLQGLAIFAALSRRTLPPWAQALVATLALLVFAPGVLAGGAVIGLMDQWVDFRRLVPPGGGDGPRSRP